MACIFGCENLEVAFAETATVTDATAEDATAGENGDDTDIESAETMFVGDTGVQADATGTDATEMDAYDEISGVSVLNANTQKTQVSNKKYEGEYHIDYILSHYSYFVQNDLEGDYVADTVGAIMVGIEPEKYSGKGESSGVLCAIPDRSCRLSCRFVE